MTAMMEEILIEPTEEWLPEAAAYKRAFEAAGDSMDGTGSLRTAQDMAQWLQTCRDFKRRETTPPQLVPATQLIYVRQADHALLGMLQVRHELNDYLRLYAGHIGYSVHPLHRRQGVATRMLAAALPYCRQLGLERVMVTCNVENEGSRRTILHNGGVYEGDSVEPDGACSATGLRCKRRFLVIAQPKQAIDLADIKILRAVEPGVCACSKA